METITNGEEFHVIPETMDDPQFLVAEADDLQDSHADEGNDSEEGIDQIRDQDRFLPIANVAKIMKMSIPDNAKIAKDAKECVQECVSEFVSFVTSEASDRCHQEKRKTINGEDLLFAMSSLGFDSYVEPLKIFLSKYRDSIKVGEKAVIQKRESFDGDGSSVEQMGASGEGVTGSVAAFVTAGGQNINIIHSGTAVNQEILPQHQQQLSSQIYTTAYAAQGDITQVHFQSQ